MLSQEETPEINTAAGAVTPSPGMQTCVLTEIHSVCCVSTLS